MRKIFLYMTITFDSFLSGPHNELDWMSQKVDLELHKDIVSTISSADTGIIGYLTTSGMIPNWGNVASCETL